MKYAVFLLAGFFIVATLLPLIRHDRWWVRIFDFPRGQIATGGIIIAVVLLLWWDRSSLWQTAFFVALLGCVVFQAWRMFPFTPLASVEVRGVDRPETESAVKILISNVLISNRNADQLVALIRERDPDIILALECDEWWEQRLRPLEDLYPYIAKEPRDNTYGMLFYSRLEVVDVEIRHLQLDSIPSVHAEIRLPCGRTFMFYGLHPQPPYPKYAEGTTQRDAELLQVGKVVKKCDRPAIVAGDLNDVAWSYTTDLFQKISGLLDPRIGRHPMCTFPVDYPLMRFPLDHVFVSGHFRLVELERLPSIGSDHFPVLVHLEYDPRATMVQEAPRADASEERQAEEKIKSAQ